MADILDQYGQPIRRQRLKTEIAGPSVGAVRTVGATRHVAGVTPPGLAALLAQAEQGDPAAWLDLAETMEERDLHYLAVLGTRRRQVSQLAVTVEPADDSADAETDAALVRAWAERSELEDELFDMLDAVAKGFSVMEIIWEVSASQWTPGRLEYRLPRWFRFDERTGSRLLLRDAGARGGWAELEPGKFVVHRHAAKSGVPIRGGVARAACWAWMFKSYSLRDWVRFVEAYGQPLRLGKYDRNANAEERDILLRAVTDIAADAAAIVPLDMQIEFISAGGSGGGSGSGSGAAYYADLLAYLDAQISKAILGQTLTTDAGTGGSGSYALGRVHDDVRHDIERSDARQLAATLTRDIARPIVLLNRGDPGPRGFPRIAIGREQETDPAVLADVLAKLVPLGLEVSAPEVRGRLGLSEPADGEQTLKAAAPVSEPAPPILETAGHAARAAAAAGDIVPSAADDDAITRAAQLAAEGWEPLMAPMIEPVLDAAREANGVEAFRARLAGLLPAMDSDPLTQSLHQQAFSAALSGAAGLEEAPDDDDEQD